MDVIDAYCERVGPGLLAEPLNAATNLSFILAAWAAWILARRTGTVTTGVRALIYVAVSVGVGSFLWHTLANSWTFYLDIVPIVVFISYYIWLYTRRVMEMSAGYAAASLAAFLLATILAFPYSTVLHGAVVYTPGLMVVLILGLHNVRTSAAAGYTLLAAAGVYVGALFFRTIDNEVCGVAPIGTHFIWHALIGLVTYLAMRSLISTLAEAPSRQETNPSSTVGSR